MEEATQQSNPELKRIEREYRRDVAIATQTPRLVRGFFALWSLLAIAGIVYTFVFLVQYLALGSFSDARLVARAGDNVSVQSAASASARAGALLISNTTIFALGENRYDFVAEVENQNDDWFAVFTYKFAYTGGETDAQIGFLMPLETKPIVMLGFETAERPAGADLVIEDVRFARADHRVIDDTAQWLAEHNQFIVGNVVHGPGDQVGTAQTTFDITNASAYSYWSPMFYVVVRRGGSIVGINQVTLRGFESGETRSVSVRWFDGAPQSGEVSIIPNIDYHDSDVYMRQDQGDPSDRFF